MSDWRGRRPEPIVEPTPSVIEADDGEGAFLAAAEAASVLEGRPLYEKAREILVGEYVGSEQWRRVGELYDRAKAFRDHPDATDGQRAQGASIMQACFDYEDRLLGESDA